MNEIITKVCPICEKQFETKKRAQIYCNIYCRMARLARKNTARLVGLKYTDPEAYAEYRERENRKQKRWRDGLSGKPNEKKEGLAKRVSEKNSAYLKENPDVKKKASKKYFQTLAGKISKKRAEKKYRQTLAGKIARKLDKYRRKAATVGKFTASEWRSLCDKYDNRCLSCGEQKELTVDHVVSLKDGGSNTIDNLQPLCRSCNSRKGAKFIDYRT